MQLFLLEQACPKFNKEYIDEFMDFKGGIVPNFNIHVYCAMLKEY